MKNTNKKIIISFTLLLLLGITYYFFFYNPPYKGLVTLTEAPLVFSHRGFGDAAPDNSLRAAKEAMENNLDGVDVDGQLTSDKELVIFHDLSVDRLTIESGRISSLTLGELKKLDLGEKFNDPKYINSYVSSFEDFVSEITPKGILMVELKVPGIKNSGIEKEAARIVKKYDAFDRVYLSSFNPFVLYRLKKIDKRINTALIFMDTNWNAELLAEIPPEDLVNLPWILRQEWIRTAIRKVVKPDLLSVNTEVKTETIDKLLEKGWPIFLWTIDEAALQREALKKKPYGLITDEPLQGKNIRDELYKK